MMKPLTPFLMPFLVLFLMLMSACTIKNQTVAGGQASLQDTDWMLVSVGDQVVTVEQDNRTSYIHFEKEDNKLKGFGSCNNFFGRYQLDGATLKLSGIGSTRMACPNMQLETKLLQALEKVTSYSISDQLLTLYQNNNAVATFRAGYLQPLDQEPGR
ncbi:META domain-containing protein [Botryobacter ruber]|uniref:META domain-containing protein n=1 Tax=Botryobacter ruber TaxID=2171629 RepID=UPI00196A7166|nr:META domain-containing protein [Botryobacter ruber]